jgi:hypothetical protein
MTFIGFRQVPEKAPEYLVYVRSLESAASGRMGCIAHHRIGHRYSQTKVSDYQVIPLIDDELEHKRLHSIGVHEFEKEIGKTEWEMIGRTLYRAVQDGVLVLDKKRALAIGAELRSA